MKKSVMLLAGIAALGTITLASCGSNFGKPLMTGTFTEKGGGTVDLILVDESKVLFDATCNLSIPNVPQEQVNKMFDKEGTYTVADGVYTFKCNWKAPGATEDNFVTYTSTYDEATGKHTVPYVMFGQEGAIQVTLTGKLPL